jgi:hypothetical protein
MKPMRIDPRERVRMVKERMLAPVPLTCEECGGLIKAGTLVLCADGYTRVYGEFVLSDETDVLHEENWPSAHVACITDLDFLP